MSKHQSIGRLKKLAGSASALRRAMNAWPPFLFVGIHIEQVSDDFRQVRVRLRKSPLTSNYVGTQFGGSLFAMTDPFWMVMVLRNLGPSYVVWDRAAEISFEAPARTALTASFVLTEQTLAQLRAEAADGSKVLHWFETEIVATDGTVVARVRKQVYVRLKR